MQLVPELLLWFLLEIEIEGESLGGIIVYLEMIIIMAMISFGLKTILTHMNIHFDIHLALIRKSNICMTYV